MNATRPGGIPATGNDTRQRVLIIKTGYSETLDQYTTGAVSLGDVLRTTVVLHLFPPEEYCVTWLTDQKGLPLLRDNPFIHRLLTVNPFTPHQLMSEWFDMVVNFEKEPGICAVADKIPAWRRYGFRFDHQSMGAHAYDHAFDAITMSHDAAFKRQQAKSWSAMLFDMLGKTYHGEPAILGYRPKSAVQFDVGLNHQVGTKYPLKRWPDSHWEALHENLSRRYQVSWQQGENEMEAYMEWIHSCRMIVTNDSLGLHLALAMGKPVVALFGPTLASEIDNHDSLAKLLPEQDCCCEFSASVCSRGTPCIASISPERVEAAAASYLGQ